MYPIIKNPIPKYSIVAAVRRKFVKRLVIGILLLLIACPLSIFANSPRSIAVSLILTGISIYLLYKGSQYQAEYEEAKADLYDSRIPDEKQRPKETYPVSFTRINQSSPMSRSTSHQSVKQIPKATHYDIIRNDSPFEDNLNYKIFEYSAVFSKTNRTRTRQIEAFSKAEALEQIKNLGYMEPITIKQLPFAPPTQEQIIACRNHNSYLPAKVCMIDVSAIISKEMAHDSIPNPELFHYATEMKIKLSYFTGKKALYSIIFDNLELRDKIAFFAFCIYRYLSNDRHGNLNTSYRKAYFYEFADSKLEDTSFIKSMNRYSGAELRYFGSIRIDGNIYSGGSKQTIAYKEVVAFLKEKHFV